MTGGPGLVWQGHSTAGHAAEAVFSACGTYRYSLTLHWHDTGRRLMCVLLNPSTADAFRSDPTLSRCKARAMDLGFGALRILNLFAFRATDPSALRAADDPVGPANDTVLQESLQGWHPDAILCGWGNQGQRTARGPAVRSLLAQTGLPLWHLGLTDSGAPRHPLYVAGSTLPRTWV